LARDKKIHRNFHFQQVEATSNKHTLHLRAQMLTFRRSWSL